MQNFIFHIPTKIYFGRGQIGSLAAAILPTKRVLIIYGQGSIKKMVFMIR